MRVTGNLFSVNITAALSHTPTLIRDFMDVFMPDTGIHISQIRNKYSFLKLSLIPIARQISMQTLGTPPAIQSSCSP